MYLSARMLVNVQNVNSYKESTQANLYQGNPSTVYFQLVDSEQQDAQSHDLRYMPAAGATMVATLNNLQTNASFTKTATQPFSQDPSIWSFSINATDQPSSGNLILTLTEGAVVRQLVVKNGLSVTPKNPSMVSC